MVAVAVLQRIPARRTPRQLGAREGLRRPRAAVENGPVGLREPVRARRQAQRTLAHLPAGRSEEHTSELQSLMRISYAVFCLKKKKSNTPNTQITHQQR